MPLSGFELHFLSRELSALAGAKLAKIHGWPDGRLRLRFRKDGESRDWVFVPGEGCRETWRLDDAPSEPPAFIHKLRKHLDNATLEGARHVNFDRVLELSLRRNEYKLVFEFFAKGNVVLLDEAGVVRACWRTEDSRSRVVRPGTPFSFIASTKKPLPELRAEDLSAATPEALQAATAVPKDYAEEIVHRAGGKGKAGIIDAAKAVLARPEPQLYRQDGKAVFASPIRLASLEEKYDGEPVDSFSRALDTLAAGNETVQAIAPAAPTALVKLRKQVDLQEKAVATLGAKESEARAAGDALYQSFGEAQAALEAARAAKKGGKGAADIEAALAKAFGKKARVKTTGVELEL